MSLMDAIFAEALQGKPLAYAEPGKAYTYNGSGAETDDYSGITYAKIANSAPDLHTMTKAVYTAPDGSQVEFLAADLEVQDWGGGQRVLATLGQITAPVVIADITGVWVYAQPGYGYCSRIEFAETIHPIEPKYIPALDALTLNGADGKQYSVTVDANGALAVTEVTT